ERARVLAAQGAHPQLGSPSRVALRRGLMPADLLPRVPAQRLESLQPSPAAAAPAPGRRGARALPRPGPRPSSLAAAALRALILARRLGRARDTLPVVLGTMVSQTLINLLALTVLGAVTLSRVSVLAGHDRALVLLALAPMLALVLVALGPVLIPPAAVSR